MASARRTYQDRQGGGRPPVRLGQPARPSPDELATVQREFGLPASLVDGLAAARAGRPVLELTGELLLAVVKTTTWVAAEEPSGWGGAAGARPRLCGPLEPDPSPAAVAATTTDSVEALALSVNTRWMTTPWSAKKPAASTRNRAEVAPVWSGRSWLKRPENGHRPPSGARSPCSG
jgi:hypothetical protein